MKRFFLAAFCLGLVSCSPSEPLPELGAVPQWTLESAGGDVVGSDQLREQVLIYDFIFTRCPATCPMMTARMADLVSRLRSEDVRFVSISVDPEFDTPSVLREYRDKVTNDSRWIFLTGSREEVRDLSVAGFFLAAEPPGEDNDGGPIVHSTKFVLVDREGLIRGYYDSLSPEMMDSLERDTKRLLRN
jgi:protein SCO1/2